MAYYNDYYDDTLMHYGVPGMKWGIRKAKAIGGFVKKMANPTERQAYAMAKKGAMKYKAFGAKKMLKNKAAAGAVSANMYKTMAKNSKAYKSAAGYAKKGMAFGKKTGRSALAVGKTGQMYGRHGVNAAKRGFGSAKGFAKKMANSTERQAWATAKKGALKYKAFNARKSATDLIGKGKGKVTGSTLAKAYKNSPRAWKAGIGVGAAVTAGAAAYGGYRAYKAYKAKRSKKGRR